MKTLGRLLPLLLALLLPGRAAPADDFAAVRAADAARIAATIAGDLTKLGNLLSDELHYAHADGRVQTKAQVLAAVGSNKVKYLSVAPADLAFQSVAPGAVAMTGRADLVAQRSDSLRVAFTIHFLAIWRQETGTWRLLAYQSAQLPDPRMP